jgi:hypothetical protein
MMFTAREHTEGRTISGPRFRRQLLTWRFRPFPTYPLPRADAQATHRHSPASKRRRTPMSRCAQRRDGVGRKGVRRAAGHMTRLSSRDTAWSGPVERRSHHRTGSRSFGMTEGWRELTAKIEASSWGDLQQRKDECEHDGHAWRELADHPFGKARPGEYCVNCLMMRVGTFEGWPGTPR